MFKPHGINLSGLAELGRHWGNNCLRPVNPLELLVSYDWSSAAGQLMLLLYIPDRSKQQARRFPAASFEQATSIRFARVSAACRR